MRRLAVGLVGTTIAIGSLAIAAPAQAADASVSCAANASLGINATGSAVTVAYVSGCKSFSWNLTSGSVKGEYTVSVSTTFSVDAGDAEAQRGSLAARSLHGATPIVDASGKPLSTVSINYVTPPAGVV